MRKHTIILSSIRRGNEKVHASFSTQSFNLDKFKDFLKDEL